MFWQEDIKEEHFTLPDDVQDAVFTIHSKVLPIDHAYLLSQALLSELPWLNQANVGIHDISVADGNGWEQDHEFGFYYPSRRSRLSLRIPKEKLAEVQSLVGKTLDLGEYQIKIVKALEPKLMSDMQIVFAKQVACDKNASENDFLQTSFQQLQALGIQPKKMMAGLKRKIQTPDGTIHTRSLMVANLRKLESVKLQEQGIGDYRLLGCGLFVPQKGIDSVDAV
ncbi:MAG TPA: type I-MYXAN CRISPR-associated protein Cas6/Cmx6 [Psychromonas hadalis]|nr:type I-MYXAN CRISPR-associated protein Cas6/Cmx6 [Gammaproteobacteria bacterium]HIP75674.1 type I-MYXAN CRISPR-associated protein Cas6/Cmx6 [Psychromonas hadalis]